jgi:hypothetical protein
MKKCQNCIANNNNMFCNLDYKTEIIIEKFKGYEYAYISPLEKCLKPKSYKDYHNKFKKLK